MTQENAGSGQPKKFEIGDLAVYPAHGVGRIEAIESRVVNGETHDFYIMKILENGMVIMIPTWNVASVGLRDIIDEDEIPKVYEVMKNSDPKMAASESQTWNRRYREYMEKLKTGSLYDVAEVEFVAGIAPLISNMLGTSVLAAKGVFWITLKEWQTKTHKVHEDLLTMNQTEDENALKEIFEILRERFVKMLVNPEEQAQLLAETIGKIKKTAEEYGKQQRK